jgi:hypothetical protein
MRIKNTPPKSTIAPTEAVARVALAQPVASPCLVTRVVIAGQPNAYKASAGTIKLKIVPSVGIIQFDVLNCSVNDDANNAVAFITSSPTALSFAVVAGKAYTLQAAYTVNKDAVANLVEDCPGQTHIADLFAIQAMAGASYPFTVS